MSEEAAVPAAGAGGGPLLTRLDSQVPGTAEGQGGPPREEVHHRGQQVNPCDLYYQYILPYQRINVFVSVLLFLLHTMVHLYNV